MLHEYEMTANAKINLFLKICGVLPNGYHELSTVMQEIALGDEISVTIDDEAPFAINLDCDANIEIQKNLCYKAAMLFEKEVIKKTGRDLDFSITIKLTKKVPSEAGLGGGSSDCACILLILNEHCDNLFTTAELNWMASKLGADVPFFLYGQTQFCRGVGEKVKKVNSLAGVSVVLVKPSMGVPTAECFRLVDSMPNSYDRNRIQSILAVINSDGPALERIERVAKFLENDLQKAALQIVPEINTVLQAIRDNQAAITMMSGSGSCCYGIFESKAAAMAAAGKLHSDERTKDCSIFVTEFI